MMKQKKITRFGAFRTSNDLLANLCFILQDFDFFIFVVKLFISKQGNFAQYFICTFLSLPFYLNHFAWHLLDQVPMLFF